MAECHLIAICPFFNDKLKNMPAIAEVMKKKYCCDTFTSCARFRVATVFGREKVPEDLFPHDAIKANIILALGPDN